MDTCFTSNFTQVVEFEIVLCSHSKSKDDYYAKLINHSVESNEMIDHIGDANKMVEDDVWKAGLEDELNKLPYTKHLDDGQYNDGVLVGYELGATWGYNKAKETLYTEEQVIEAYWLGVNKGNGVNVMSINSFIQSLKQSKE
jgi:hypothetical protein